MIEDKLSREERIRLEALNQAVASKDAITGRLEGPTTIIEKAKKFEAYIKGEES